LKDYIDHAISNESNDEICLNDYGVMDKLTEESTIIALLKKITLILDVII
jgi:hypothetical protein